MPQVQITEHCGQEVAMVGVLCLGYSFEIACLQIVGSSFVQDAKAIGVRRAQPERARKQRRILKLELSITPDEIVAMAKHHGLRSWLCQLFGCCKKRIVFGWTVGQPQLKKDKKMLTLEVTNEQKIKVHLNPVTEAGKPTTLDGAPVWSVVSGPGTVIPAADGLSADLLSDDTNLGDTIYQVRGDADLGGGNQEVADTITLRTTHANAKNLGLVADAPVLK